MSNKENFVGYEYKTVNTTRDSAGMHIDCMESFGWSLVENDGYDVQDLHTNLNPVNLGRNIANAAQTFGETTDAARVARLTFRRDRRIENKQQLDRLEREYEAALTAISKAERKNSAQTMGVSLGAGIIGSVFVGISAYNFVSSNIALGVAFATIGSIGWAIGFLANKKIGNKTSAQTEPYMQEQMDIIYCACEKAHALLV